MSFDVILRQLLEGFGQTCLIFALTLVFSLPLGMLVYFGRVSRIKPVSWIVKIFISIMRGTPLMLQLMIWYYAPFYLWGMPIGGYKFTAVILGCSMNYAAYFAEIYRSGIEAIPIGQYEAAQLLGYDKRQTFMKIIMPQMIKNILPAVTNEVITLVKDTSLSRIIALQEVIWAGQSFMKGNMGIAGVIWPLFFTAVYYLIFNGILTVLLGRLERKLEYFR